MSGGQEPSREVPAISHENQALLDRLRVVVEGRDPCPDHLVAVARAAWAQRR